jgi:hypothetical protein
MVGVGKPAELRNAFWLRRFRPSRIHQTLSESLRPDWFDSTLQRVARYLDGLAEQPPRRQIGNVTRPHELHRWLRAAGQERLTEHIGGVVRLLPLSGRETAQITLDTRSLSAIACALLQKHVLSNSYPRYQAASGLDQIESMCRFSGAPLGCLRVSSRGVIVYWTPSVLKPNRMAKGLL